MFSVAKIPGCSWILANSEIASFVNGYLPVVGLLVLVLILPAIFESVAEKFEKRKTKSDVQKSVLQRYFYYQVSSRVWFTSCPYCFPAHGVVAGSCYHSFFCCVVS